MDIKKLIADLEIAASNKNILFAAHVATNAEDLLRKIPEGDPDRPHVTAMLRAAQDAGRAMTGIALGRLSNDDQ